jgi:hypothetical protein
MNNTSQTNEKGWRTDLFVLTRRLKVSLPISDSNRYNYKLDTLGAESEYAGFATVMIYLQLSPKINLLLVQRLINEISWLYSKRSFSRFLLLFMNNPDGYPKYLYTKPTHKDHASRLVRKALQEMQPADSAASKQLTQLTPQDTQTFNQQLKKPRRDKNLFVIIYDSDKITLSSEVISETTEFKHRFITACIEDDTIKLAGFDALL